MGRQSFPTQQEKEYLAVYPQPMAIANNLAEAVTRIVGTPYGLIAPMLALGAQQLGFKIPKE
ncbi:MAG: hypothetical protein ACRCZS_25990 [Chroococcidiopsis sp.]